MRIARRTNALKAIQALDIFACSSAQVWLSEKSIQEAWDTCPSVGWMSLIIADLFAEDSPTCRQAQKIFRETMRISIEEQEALAYPLDFTTCCMRQANKVRALLPLEELIRICNTKGAWQKEATCKQPTRRDTTSS